MGKGGTQVTAKGGADLVFAHAMPEVPQVVPYAEVDGRWAVTETFGLSASAGAETLIQAPADGVADWALSAEAGLQWMALDGVLLSASGFAGQDYAAASQTLIETRRGLRFGVTKALVEGVTAGLNYNLSETEYAGGGYQSARLGLDLNAVI